MKILVVSPDLPIPTWGFGTRVYQLAKHLGDRHQVTVLSYYNPEEMQLPRVQKVLNVHGIPVNGRSRRARQARSALSIKPFHASGLESRNMQDAISAHLADGHDIVQVESSRMMTFDYSGATCLVLDEHNVESELLARSTAYDISIGRRAFNRLEQRKYEHFERATWPRASGVVVTSEREQHHVEISAPDARVAVVPNSVDPDYFSPRSEPLVPDSLVFTGLLTYRPNLDGVRYFLDDVMPLIRRQRPSVTLTVVGGGRPADLDDLRARGATVTGWVEDVRPYMAAAEVVVVPLRIGSGTRLKVVESMAMGKPVVSTTLGQEGLNAVSGEHLLAADDPGQFADAVRRFLADRAEAIAMGARARQFVLAHYTWERSSRDLERFHASLLGARHDLARRGIVRGRADAQVRAGKADR